MISFDYKNKTALITGAAGGLGLAIATAFHTAGANVVIIDINQERLDEASKTFADGQERIFAVNADITSIPAMEDVFAKTVQRFGSVDIVVNNAGITDLFKPIGEVEKDYLEKLIAVNTVAPAMIAGIAVRYFLKQEPTCGVVLNVGSAAALHGHRAGRLQNIFVLLTFEYTADLKL